MYAIVETGGKQYRVTPGDTFRVEKLPGELGATVELDRVLLLSDEESCTIGTPMVDGAKVICTVLSRTAPRKSWRCAINQRKTSA